MGRLNPDDSEIGVFDPVIPDPVVTSNTYKSRMLISLDTSHMERSIKAKISVLIDRQHWLNRQLNVQIIGNTGSTWKVSCRVLSRMPSSLAVYLTGTRPENMQNCVVQFYSKCKQVHRKNFKELMFKTSILCLK